MINTKKSTLAIFDFDGTITKKDTLNDLIMKEFGYIKFLGYILILSPLILLYKLGFLANHIPKGMLFSKFFSGMEYPRFKEICQKYASCQIDSIVRTEAKEKIKWHHKEGHNLIIITASVGNWIEPWAAKNNINEVISTQIEVIDGKLTGKFFTKNCYGSEKVKRLLEKYPNRDNYIIYAYGDSLGDKDLLKIADYPFFKSF